MRNLAIFDPTDEFNFLQDRINRIFDESLRFPRRYSESVSTGVWSPTVDVHETDENYELVADLPGMKKQDINIDIRANVLTLSGERKHEDRKENENEVRVERSFGKFVRSFTLPQNVDSENIKASYKDGVLRLTLPKREEARPKQIKIES